MAKEFVDFRWTSWDDSVGSKLCDEIEYTIEKTSYPYEKYLYAVNKAKSVLSSKVTYCSQKTVIGSLEVKSHV